MGLIYLDTCLLVYLFESDPVFGDRTRAALASESADPQKARRFAISPLVNFECLAGPMRSGYLVLQRVWRLTARRADDA